MSAKPIVKVFSDEKEAKADDILNRFYKDKDNVSLLLEAATLFSHSTNPEGKEIARLLEGIYYRLLSRKESDLNKVIKLLEKSCELLKNPKENSTEFIQTKLELLKRKSEINDKDAKIDPSTFKERAKLFKQLDDELNFNTEMCLYYMFLATRERDPNKIVKNAELMHEHVGKLPENEFSTKMKSLYHQIKSSTSYELTEAYEEARLAVVTLDAIDLPEKEKQLALGRLNFTKAHLTKNKKERSKLLMEAAMHYKDAGNEKLFTEAVDLSQVKSIRVSVFML